MLTWMAYSTLVASLICAAAALLEPTVMGARAHKRFLWAAAIVAAVVLTSLSVIVDGPHGDLPATAGLVPDFALFGIWMVGATLCVAVLVTSAIRVAVMQRRWREEVVAGVPVRVSHDVGPAVVGLLHHGIVVPGWVCSLRDDEQRMVMSHEREHVRAGDPLLLWATTLLVALLPWNVALWYALHRLRHAIEMDCDARVLRSRTDARAYCTLLVDVGERTLAGAAPVVALAEPSTLLERRITAMTAPPRFIWRRAAAGFAGAVLLGVAACRAPQPETAPRARFVALMRELNDMLRTDSVTRTLSAGERENARRTAQFADRALGANASSEEADPWRKLVANPTDSVLHAAYPQIFTRTDTVPLVAVIKFDTIGRVLSHKLLIDPPLSGSVHARDFTDRPTIWWQWAEPPALHLRIMSIVERPSGITASSRGTTGSTTAFGAPVRDTVTYGRLADLIAKDVSRPRAVDVVMAQLSPAPDTAVKTYYSSLLNRSDTATQIVVLRYDGNGILVSHAARPQVKDQVYTPRDFTSRDIALFTMLNRQEQHLNIAVVMEMGWVNPKNLESDSARLKYAEGTLRRALAGEIELPRARQYGIRVDSLARREFPEAYKSHQDALVIGAIFDASSRLVAFRETLLPERDVFDLVEPGKPPRRPRGTDWTLSAVFGGALPRMTQTGSQMMNDAPGTAFVFGELAPNDTLSFNISRDSLLVLARRYEQAAVMLNAASSRTTYVLIRFDAKGNVIGHESTQDATDSPSRFAPELFARFFPASMGLEEARLVMLRDGPKAELRGALWAVVVRPVAK